MPSAVRDNGNTVRVKSQYEDGGIAPVYRVLYALAAKEDHCALSACKQTSRAQVAVSEILLSMVSMATAKL